ncbi:hypothetical protein PSCICJ_51150 [Pseudomonas cichorii]|nr:hypothetical protein PSCICJ_51150 [Pseudomonas cichorii]
MRKKAPGLSVNGFNLILNLPSAQRRKISETIRFLRQELTRSSNTQEIEIFNQDMERLISDGGPKDIESL